jgi:hypothetical protein
LLDADVPTSLCSPAPCLVFINLIIVYIYIIRPYCPIRPFFFVLLTSPEVCLFPG